MKAITVQPIQNGTLPRLTAAPVPDPAAREGQVIVEVAAAGVNPADVLQRRGLYPPPPGASPLLGLEVSGVISSVGRGVEQWRAGDRVAALLDGGGYAERVAVPASQLFGLPDGVDLVEAAALPEALCTAWSNLVDVAGLSADEVVLIHGGSGGVGTIAVQLALTLGARVVTTAGGPARTARCLDLLPVGVPPERLHAIDHRTDDFVDRVRELTGGAGADVVLDVVGGAYLGRNVRSLATGGRLVVIGLPKGRTGELDLGTLLAKRASVHGTTLRARPAQEKAAIVAAVRERAWPLVAAGRIRPVVHEALPLDRAADAHELLGSGEVFGKIVLVP